ncbi:MAG: neutral zinc metallopeptidase [Pseudomonadota bacterium]
MRWKGRRQSTNVDDRRRAGGRRAGGLKLGGGIGTIVLVLVAMYFGIDPQVVLQATGGGATAPAPQRPISAAEEERAAFTRVVLAETEDVWNAIFAAGGENYAEPTLVLFSGSTPTACGYGQAAMGPFYCPADRQVYIDLSFFDQLARRFGAPGDFAQAYVIAHEVGHHLQTLLGISQQVHSQRRAVSEAEGNRLSVRQELQADCFAGIWAHHAERARLLEAGDIEEALRAASAIGDDTLQRRSSGRVVPESFTHGTSEQRVRWFRRGFDSGNMNECDSFSARSL